MKTITEKQQYLIKQLNSERLDFLIEIATMKEKLKDHKEVISELNEELEAARGGL